MNKFFYGFLTAAILFGSAVSVSAAEYEFYVRNRPFKGSAVVSGETVKACLDDLFTSLQYSWNIDGGKLYVYTLAESKKNVKKAAVGGPLITSEVSSIVFGGKEFSLPMSSKAGKVIVDVKDFAKAFGLKYSVSPVMGSIDLSAPVSKSQISALSLSSSAAKSKSGGSSSAVKKGSEAKYKLNASGQIETDGSNRESPIVVNDIEWFNNDSGGAYTAEVHMNSAKITNSGAESLTGVKFSVNAVLYDGTVMNSWSADVGTLEGGKSYTLVPDNPVWFNYNRVPVDCKALISHDPPKDAQEGSTQEASSAQSTAVPTSAAVPTSNSVQSNPDDPMSEFWPSF
ncbi:MAG: hypothetical protein ACI376_06915 [Candidatus Bruticola sp.]